MRSVLETRLETLRAEYASGQEVAAELQKKQRALRETLLRISGAIQVLEELLGNPPGPVEPVSVGPVEPGPAGPETAEQP